jgi:hypothetical protein
VSELQGYIGYVDRRDVVTDDLLTGSHDRSRTFNAVLPSNTHDIKKERMQIRLNCMIYSLNFLISGISLAG